MAHLPTCEDTKRKEMKDQSALSERWSANQMRQAGEDALDRLRRGLAPNADRLPVVNGLIDLRGFQFPSLLVLSEISGSHGRLSGCDRVQRIKGRLTLRRITLTGIDFRGSRFERCRFAGRLYQVWFRGGFPDASPGEQDALRRTGVDPTSLVNPMHQIDFSDAVLDDCMFVNGIDLSTCRFSNDGVHIVIQNRIETFRELQDRISKTWPEPSRSAALRLCHRLSSRQDQVGQPMDAINRQTFGAPPNGKAESRPWLRSFLDLVQQLA